MLYSIHFFHARKYYVKYAKLRLRLILIVTSDISRGIFSHTVALLKASFSQDVYFTYVYVHVWHILSDTDRLFREYSERDYL